MINLVPYNALTINTRIKKSGKYPKGSYYNGECYFGCNKGYVKGIICDKNIIITLGLIKTNCVADTKNPIQIGQIAYATHAKGGNLTNEKTEYTVGVFMSSIEDGFIKVQLNG